MSKTLGLNVSLYISSLAQKAKSIQIHPPYTRLPSPDYEQLILTKFHYDWVKIVDFLIKAHF